MSWDDLDKGQPGLVITGEDAVVETCRRVLHKGGVGKKGGVVVNIDRRGPSSFAVQLEATWLHLPDITRLRGTATLMGGDEAMLGANLVTGLLEARPAHASPELPDPGPAVSVGVGNQMACSLHRGGVVRCWGSHSVPLPVAGLGSVEELSVGGHQACARRSDGRVACWGQLSDDGGVTNQAHQVCGVEGAVSMSVGARAACALDEQGRVRCWNQRSHSYQPCGSPDTPLEVHGLGWRPEAISVGLWVSCALNQGRVACWEHQSSGHLPKVVMATLQTSLPDIMSLSQGAAVCGTSSDGQVWCRQNAVWKEREDVRNTELLAWSGTHGCALANSRVLKCWGMNHLGQLGDGTQAFRKAPVDVALNDVAHIDTGISATCAVAKGKTYCWGGAVVGPTSAPLLRPTAIRYSK